MPMNKSEECLQQQKCSASVNQEMDNPKKQSKQSKRFCVTWNNYTETTLSDLKTLCSTSLRYLIIGSETAPTTGTKHYQIYLETKKKMTITGLKKLLNSASPHIEIARGTAEENKEYCTKEELLYEWGAPVKERQRTDLEEIRADIDAGMSYADLWDNHFNLMLQYRRGLEEYSNLQRLRRSEPPKVYIWHGATGTGKTRKAFDMAAEFNDSFWVWPGDDWFDGYRGQRVAIFDEFHGGDSQGIRFDLWKKLCDRYPLTVKVKGGFTNWNPEVIIFTSNIDPHYWWPDEKNKPVGWFDQFSRRCTEIKEFS